MNDEETREQCIARWERQGFLDPNCAACKEIYESDKMPYDIFAPRHKASDSCESGKQNHCTCDVCF